MPAAAPIGVRPSPRERIIRRTSCGAASSATRTAISGIRWATAPVSVELFSVFGGFFGGDPAQVVPRVSLRVGETFNTQIAWERSDVNLPGGAFVTNLARLRVNYSFTTRMFVQALVQYNDSADLWSSNIRFAVLSDANTGFFIVYNETEGIGAFIPPGAGRSLTLKYSYLFDLLD